MGDLVGYCLYDVAEPFTEPNECEVVIDAAIAHLEREFGATVQTEERGDMAVVSLIVQGQAVNLQGDWGLGLVFLSASTPEANAVTERVALSLKGRPLVRERVATNKPKASR